MRICLLTTQDLDAVPFAADDWPCDPRPFMPEAEWQVENLTGQNCPARVTELVETGDFDLFFNLCDAAADEDGPGIEVVQTLEKLGVAFSGATSKYYEPTREMMKQACLAEGIATPAYVFAESDDDIQRAADELTFPLFVKHHSSYASVSISRASKVATPAGLVRQATKIIKRHGKALIEEYIDGIECTVLVAENAEDLYSPITYMPVRYEFPAGESFKHADLKWVIYEGLHAFPVDDPVLNAKLRDVSARFFTALDGASFGRCDLRVDAAGTAYMLEINPNCGVYFAPGDYGGADFCLANDPVGHEGFTRHLIDAAFARHA